MLPETETALRCEESLRRLLGYCRAESWQGYDPYDGLNSALARALPVRNRLTRTALTQLIKRSPVNLRPVVGVKKGLNAKGVALAARAILLLSRAARENALFTDSAPTDSAFTDSDGGLAKDLAYLMGALESLRSEGYEEACWGYNFDWQSRAFFAPRGTPNVVCTAFAAHAHLDLYEATGDRRALETAKSSCRFLLERLNRTEGAEGYCFSYTPLDRSRVHNVNMLAAELLARVFGVERDERLRRASHSAAAYTLARQRDDGSWPYGEAGSQSWIDSFHTGFILVSLKNIIAHLGADSWRAALARGYDFYEGSFFLADFSPKYYHDRLYPVDVHSAAQAIITFLEMTDLMPGASRKATKALNWAIESLQDPAGFFYFQRHRFYTIKTPFIRWAQAWMLYALSLYLSRNPVGQNV
jgi:hypothetical protein